MQEAQKKGRMTELLVAAGLVAAAWWLLKHTAGSTTTATCKPIGL